MGRPIKKAFFGNLNAPGQNYASGGLSGVGGEGVASVPVTTQGTQYPASATVTFSAPQLVNGVTATGTVVRNAATGAITAITIVNSGSGYTAAPTITASTTPGVAAVFGTVVLTTNRVNAIQATAFIPGGSSAAAVDIIKQSGSKQYLVSNAQGKGECRLAAVASGSLVAGQMNLIATDSANGTYYVTKLTTNHAVLTRITGAQFANNTKVMWVTPGAAVVAGQSVTIANA